MCPRLWLAVAGASPSHRPCRLLRRIAVLLALLLVLDACGSGGAKHTSATTTDQRIVGDAQLTLTDFPSGWKQQNSSEVSKSESTCEGVGAAKGAASARKTSPDFVMGDSTRAASSAFVYADVAAAARAFQQLSSEGTRSCTAEAAVKGLAAENHQGVTIGKVATGQVSIAPLGEERTAGRLTVPVRASGLNEDFYVDLVLVRVGRALVWLIFLFLAVLTALVNALLAALTHTAVDRLQTALTSPSSNTTTTTSSTTTSTTTTSTTAPTTTTAATNGVSVREYETGLPNASNASFYDLFTGSCRTFVAKYDFFQMGVTGSGDTSIPAGAAVGVGSHERLSPPLPGGVPYPGPNQAGVLRSGNYTLVHYQCG